MKGKKQGPFQESFYHQPEPIRMPSRNPNKRGGSAKKPKRK